MTKHIIRKNKKKEMKACNSDYITFVSNIVAGAGWISKNDIARQWSLMFNKHIIDDQFDHVVKSLEANDLIKDETTVVSIDW